ncbi:MAG: SOS response-associated peptidase [Enterococcus sp.]
MCGRYWYDLHSEKLKQYREEALENSEIRSKELASGEIYPSNHIVAIGHSKDKIFPSVTRWGFESFKKGQLMINARSETVEEKQTFHKSFLERRVVIPMSGFYEWSSEKEKYLFRGSEILYVGGLYRMHHPESGPVAESIILTTKPNQAVKAVHDRMPLLIEESEIWSWLLDLDFARNKLKQAMPELSPAQLIR